MLYILLVFACHRLFAVANTNKGIELNWIIIVITTTNY
jgi:hypothetical protein